MAVKITTQINKIRNQIADMPKHTIEQAGQKAMEFIGDYPLYASGLSNITYEEAIMIALVLGDEIKYAFKEEDNEG